MLRRTPWSECCGHCQIWSYPPFRILFLAPFSLSMLPISVLALGMLLNQYLSFCPLSSTSNFLILSKDFERPRTFLLCLTLYLLDLDRLGLCLCYQISPIHHVGSWRSKLLAICCATWPRIRHPSELLPWGGHDMMGWRSRTIVLFLRCPLSSFYPLFVYLWYNVRLSSRTTKTSKHSSRSTMSCINLLD
jgi:hypothetical protein